MEDSSPGPGPARWWALGLAALQSRALHRFRPVSGLFSGQIIKQPDRIEPGRPTAQIHESVTAFLVFTELLKHDKLLLVNLQVEIEQILLDLHTTFIDVFQVLQLAFLHYSSLRNI